MPLKPLGPTPRSSEVYLTSRLKYLRQWLQLLRDQLPAAKLVDIAKCSRQIDHTEKELAKHLAKEPERTRLRLEKEYKRQDAMIAIGGKVYEPILPIVGVLTEKNEHLPDKIEAQDAADFLAQSNPLLKVIK